MGLIGQELNGSYSSYHFDIRGSTTAITDKNASVTDRFDYGQYGELVNHTGNTSTPFLYNGRDGVMTDNNGLYYMRARYYNPDTKRFINQDILTGSISDGRTLNRYAYVNVNPISLTDPFGLSPNINPLSILPGLLDLVSMIDPFEITDLISAGIYALEGDYTMAKTLISTKAGLKQIKDIKAGDEVYSANPETGEKGLKKVKEVYINETDTLVHVFAGDEEIRTTETHPFWVEGKGWIDAGSLQTGDRLRLYSGDLLTVDKVVIEYLDEVIEVYNFEVEDWHTYFVSETSVLVHNMCAPNAGVGNSSNLPAVIDRRAAAMQKIQKSAIGEGSGQ